MRRTVISSLAGLALVPLLGLALAHAGDVKKVDAPTGTAGKHNTAIQFVATPKEAAEKALKEEKLVFILHVSGIFEDPSLT